MRLRRTAGLVRQLMGLAQRLRTRSIARSLSRTIVTCPKSAPPRTLPPGRRRRTGPTRRGLWPMDRRWQSEQPDPNADSRGLRDPRRPRRLWVSRPRPPARLQSTAVLSGKDGWRHWGRAEKPDGRGADCVEFQALLTCAGGTGAVGLSVPLDSLALAYRTRVRYPVS
jgi:hypothetical protein